MKYRSPIVVLLLSIITCGIYGIVWMAMIQNELNETEQNWKKTGGGLVVFLTFITCGIYGIVWYFMTASRINKMTGVNCTITILLLIIAAVIGSIFFPLLGLATWFILPAIQSAINKGFDPRNNYGNNNNII